ncbi:general substrate transporter [Mycena olivaceomarginata]|nr:general substrate transporter [Mycena olivaceomarginata]
MPGGAVVLGTTNTSRIEAHGDDEEPTSCVSSPPLVVSSSDTTLVGWGGVLGMPYFPFPTGFFNASNLPADFALPAWEKSLMTSIFSAGTFFGALIAGDIADSVGRRPTIVMGCVVFAVGCVLEIAPMDVLLASSLAVSSQGAGIGFIAPPSSSCTYPRSHPRRSVAPFFRVTSSASPWVFLLPTLSSTLAEIMPILSTRRPTFPQTSYVGSWLACFEGSLFEGSSNVRRTMVGTGSQCAQQFTGINFILYFGTSFFQTLGTINNPFLITLVTTLVNVLSTPFSFYIIERFGRCRILLIGGSCMVVCQYIVAIIGTAAPHATLPGGNPLAVKAEIAFICLNIAAFATTWGPAACVVVGEMFPLPIRSRGVGMSIASTGSWNCIIGVITPYFVSADKLNLGPKVFFIWGSTAALSVTFAYFFVSETKGLSLEQVDQMLAETSPAYVARMEAAHHLGRRAGQGAWEREGY